MAPLLLSDVKDLLPKLVVKDIGVGQPFPLWHLRTELQALLANATNTPLAGLQRDLHNLFTQGRIQFLLIMLFWQCAGSCRELSPSMDIAGKRKWSKTMFRVFSMNWSQPYARVGWWQDPGQDRATSSQDFTVSSSPTGETTHRPPLTIHDDADEENTTGEQSNYFCSCRWSICQEFVQIKGINKSLIAFISRPQP